MPECYFIFFFFKIGVSIAGYGTLHNNFLGSSPATANYSVDNQDFFTFPLTTSTTNDLSNQKFFETEQLSPGLHTLVITYIGNDTDGNAVPINFNYLMLQVGPSNITFNQSSICLINGSLSTGNSSSNSTSTANKSSTDLSAGVIGGIVGAVCGLVLLLLVIAFWKKKE